MWARFSNMERENRNVVISYTMIVVLLALGTLFITPNFISATFLSQQLRLASFLGIIAAVPQTKQP